jgi:hypothetical protein
VLSWSGVWRCCGFSCGWWRRSCVVMRRCGFRRERGSVRVLVWIVGGYVGVGGIGFAEGCVYRKLKLACSSDAIRRRAHAT